MKWQETYGVRSSPFSEFTGFYAGKGDRAIRFLARSDGYSFNSKCVEDSLIVLNVDHMKRAECKLFRRS